MKTDLTCPHCGGGDVLPFEDDSPSRDDGTIFLILSIGALLFIGYVLFLISTYLFFPGMIFISIIITTRWINRREREKKNAVMVSREFMCAECGGYFSAYTEE